MVYSIIPARGGSKGVPGKNIRLLAGHPLIAYSIRASLKCPSIRRVIISTDSEEIAGIAKRYGAEVPFYRPSELAGDRSSDYEFVAHALDWFQSQENKVPHFLVHLRPTTPLRDPAVIESAIHAIQQSADFTALRSVHEMPESAYKSFEIDGQRLKAVCSGSFELDKSNEARQQFPKTYYANGYVDILRSSFVTQNKRIHGNCVNAFATSSVVEIDSQDDFDYLEFLIKKDSTLVRKLMD